MKIKYGDLKRLIREEREYAEALQEIFGMGKKKVSGEAMGSAHFAGALDKFMEDLFGLNKQVEELHKVAPQGPAKAIVAGIHSDLFNKAAEIRKYVEQLKTMAKKGGAPQKGAAPASV